MCLFHRLDNIPTSVLFLPIQYQDTQELIICTKQVCPLTHTHTHTHTCTRAHTSGSHVTNADVNLSEGVDVELTEGVDVELTEHVSVELTDHVDVDLVSTVVMMGMTVVKVDVDYV